MAGRLTPVNYTEDGIMTRVAIRRKVSWIENIAFVIIFLAIVNLIAVPMARAESEWLTISGKIKSEHGSIYYTPGDMSASPATEIVTTSPWTTGKTVFRGVLLRDVLEKVAASGTVLKVSAEDGFTVEIPVSDAEKYDVIIAYKVNGEWLEQGVYAPFWIIYPFDRHKELAQEEYYARSIWQMTKIIVE